MTLGTPSPQTLDISTFAMIEIVGDHAIFFTVRFWNDEIINADTGVFVLDLSDFGFSDLPVVFAGQFAFCEGTGDCVVTDFAIKHVG